MKLLKLNITMRRINLLNIYLYIEYFRKYLKFILYFYYLKCLFVIPKNKIDLKEMKWIIFNKKMIILIFLEYM